MQRVHRAMTLASCLASAAFLFRATPAWADPAPAPRADVVLSESYAARAFEAYRRKDHASAVALYQQALEAAPSADILYNIARVYDVGLRDRPLAITFYNRYVGDPGASASRIAIANERLTELRAAAATPEGPEPPAAPATAVVPSATGAAPMRPSDDGSSGLTTAALVAGSLGLVGVGLGVGFGLAAKSDLDLSERYCDGNRCTSQRGVDAANSATREANIATVSFSVGGGLLALGTVLWFLADDGDERQEVAPQLGWSPRIGPNELSLSFAGSFGTP
jgi:tetratricopeptide (TPR) repeat protein